MYLLTGGISILVALLGFDQSSGVQQQALASLKKLAEADVAALEAHLPTLMPSLCALMGSTSGEAGGGGIVACLRGVTRSGRLAAA